MRQPLRRHPRWAPAVMLLSLLPFGAIAHATVDSVIRGTVHDENLAPLVGASVVLHDAMGATAARTKTDAQGAFVFRGIELGDYTVEAHAPGHEDDHRHVVVGSSQIADLELYCVTPAAVTTVVEQSSGVALPTKATASVSTLSRKDLKDLPKGEDNPITDVLGTQPGFVSDSFGNVYARGNHADVQYQIDGIPIPDSVGNVFAQALPVRLIEHLEILTGGMPAEFGDRLAAVVNITTRKGGQTPEGLVQLRYGSFQTIEPSAFYSRSIGRLGVFVGGSYLQSQRALDPPAISPILHDDGRNGRAFLRLDWNQSARDRVELFASYAYNFFQIPIDPTVTPLDPARPDLVRPVDSFGNPSPPFVPHDTDAGETEHEAFITASWVHQVSPQLQFQLAPYYKLSYGALAADPIHALGAEADSGTTASDVTRTAHHAGGVFHLSFNKGNHLLKAGAQVDYLQGETSYQELVRDDASPTGGVDPTLGGRGTDSTGALLSGVYVQDHWDRGRFSLNAGARGDELHVMLSGGRTDDQFGVSPRLGASFAFLKELVGHAFVGVNWQPPAPLDAPNAARALGVVAPGTEVPYDVKAQTDVYGELGLDARVVKQLKLGAVGWGRYAWNQLDDTAIGSTNLVANYNFQRGRAVGVEGRADLAIGYWLSAFANISWEIAQGKGIASAKYLFSPEDLANTSWQTLDHVQTLTANVGLTVREGGFSASGLFNYGSGLRTGPSNQATVPGHVRVDATLQYAFEKVPLRPRIAVDVINLFDAHYAFRISNGFVGSSYAAPRSFFVRFAVPLSKGGHE